MASTISGAAAPATVEPDPTGPPAHEPAPARTGSLATVCGLVLVLVSGVIGAGELHDNSFLTHLATGRWIGDGHLGRLWMGTADPYLTTSGGRTWVVQSWLASVLYATAEHVAGAAGIRLLVAAICMGIAGVLWRLSEPGGTLVARVIAVGSVVAVGGTVWNERPLMFGLLFMALALLGAEGRLATRWLVPVGWLWVNTHGSFPLGIVALVALAVGARLDRAPVGRELRAARDLALGCVLGGLLSPAGPVLLTFPVTLLARQDVLSNVQEWKRTDFSEGWAQLFAAMVLLALWGIARRPSWRSALPVVVFGAAGVLAARNVLVASVVLSPIIARGLAGLGSLRERRSRLLRTATLALGALTPLLVLSTAAQGDYRFDAYPVAAVDHLEARGLLDGDVTVLSQDFTGNYLEWRYGPGVEAFIDDRYDLHDEQLVEDYFVLHHGRDGWAQVLDTRRIDVVLWEAGTPLVELLERAPGWQVSYDGRNAAGAGQGAPSASSGLPEYVVLCRVTVAPCFAPPTGR